MSIRAVDKTKAFLKATFPGGVQIYRRLREVQQTRSLRSPSIRTAFTDIYRKNLWGDSESVSGTGSTLARTAAIRSALPVLLKSLNAQSLLDAPCGDFNWMQFVNLEGIEYVGADVVPELITRNRQMHSARGRTFVVSDVTKDRLPKVDVILCRDCFIHLSFRDINAALINFKRSDSRFLLATTHVDLTRNKDTRTGDWRLINLQLSPFNFPQPQQLLVEDAELGKCLGLWSLKELEVRHVG